MEPENRPYVDPDTRPGDKGTGEWADTLPEADDAGPRGPLAASGGPTDAEGAIEGSPADEFITDPDAIAARNDEPKASE